LIKSNLGRLLLVVVLVVVIAAGKLKGRADGKMTNEYDYPMMKSLIMIEAKEL